MSVVLGVHDGHNASAALLRDGRIELALQEERLTRVKNQGDAPAGALHAALAIANAAGPVAAPVVALNGHYMNYHQWQRETILRDYLRNWSTRLRSATRPRLCPVYRKWFPATYRPPWRCERGRLTEATR